MMSGKQSRKIKLGIIFGGVSSEHEVSLASAKNVLEALDRTRYEILEIGILKDGRWVIGDGVLTYLVCAAEQSRLPSGMSDVIETAKSRLKISSDLIWPADKIKAALLPTLVFSKGRLPDQEQFVSALTELDVVFPVLHGAMGEDGSIQGLLQIARVAVVGCGILSSSVCLDKVITKELLAYHGIPQARWVDVLASELPGAMEELRSAVVHGLGGYPVFVKPANTGSSVGISKVKNESELSAAIKEAMLYDRKILIEEAIQGRELEIAVLGNQKLVVSPVVSEIIPHREFYDYEAKYLDNQTTIELPAQVSANLVKRIQELACAAFRAVDGSGMARIDFFYREATDEILLNEINTIPGFTQISQYPMLMKAAGLTYSQLLDALVDAAMERHREYLKLVI